MAVALRLRRDGSKGNPYYRVVAADKRSPRDGKFIEILGNYDPMKKGDEQNYEIDLEKAEDWLSKGAQPSDTVKSLIRKARKAQSLYTAGHLYFRLPSQNRGT